MAGEDQRGGSRGGGLEVQGLEGGEGSNRSGGSTGSEDACPRTRQASTPTAQAHSNAGGRAGGQPRAHNSAGRQAGRHEPAHAHSNAGRAGQAGTAAALDSPWRAGQAGRQGRQAQQQRWAHHGGKVVAHARQSCLDGGHILGLAGGGGLSSQGQVCREGGGAQEGSVGAPCSQHRSWRRRSRTAPPGRTPPFRLPPPNLFASHPVS